MGFPPRPTARSTAGPSPRCSPLPAARPPPAYTLPALVVPVGGLPLSPNGKIDRRALTALIPDLSGKTADSAGTPMTQPAGLMAQSWGPGRGGGGAAPRGAWA